KITLEALAKTTKFFEKHPDLITLAVDNDQAGRDFIDKLQDKGLPIVVDLPPLLDGAEKSDWNEVLKVQKSEQVLRSPASSLNDL
ncbi:toprim domain-containing protein, partial [Streptococcus suis]